MGKDYWPTKEILEDLRKEGKFAFLPCTIKYLEIALLLLILYFLKSNISLYFGEIQKFLNGSLNIHLKDIVLFVLMIPLCIFPFVLLIILLHSKFLFSFQNLFSKKVRRTSSISQKLLNFFIYPIFSFAYLGLVYIFTMEFLSLINNNNSNDMLSLTFSNLGSFIFLIMIFFIFLAVISVAIGKFIFLRKNRMSMQELIARSED